VELNTIFIFFHYHQHKFSDGCDHLVTPQSSEILKETRHSTPLVCEPCFYQTNTIPLAKLYCQY